jgi:ABC-type molybdate transport system substrate-binding protein
MKQFPVCPPLLFFFLAIVGINLSSAEPSREITVSAAISLKNVFEEIGKTFEKKHLSPLS